MINLNEEASLIDESLRMPNKDNKWTLSGWVKSSKKSKSFDSYKVYVIEVFDVNERFIKIGRTFSTISKRFANNKSLPYEYDILKEITDNPFRIFNLELKLKKLCKEFKYIPKKKFNGMHECFTEDSKEILLNYNK